MSNEVHVLPVDDLIDHQENDECPCGPRSEPVVRADGSVGWSVVHHSLDGRERAEGLYRLADENGVNLPPPDVDWQRYRVRWARFRRLFARVRTGGRHVP